MMSVFTIVIHVPMSFYETVNFKQQKKHLVGFPLLLKAETLKTIDDRGHHIHFLYRYFENMQIIFVLWDRHITKECILLLDDLYPILTFTFSVDYEISSAILSLNSKEIYSVD